MIAVFGSSGLLGSEVTYQALKRGHKVVAFVRDPDKLKIPQGSGGEEAGNPLTNDNLKIVQGSVTSPEDVEKAFANNDVTAVVVSLGGRTSAVGKTMLTDGTANIIRAMKARGVKRIAVVTSIGVGDSYAQAPFVFRMLMNTVMRVMIADKNNQESLFTAPEGIGKDLEYVIVRPGGLTVDKPTGVVNVIKGQAGSIARADVADFILGAVSDDSFPYMRQAPCISSVGGTSWTKDRSSAARGEM